MIHISITITKTRYSFLFPQIINLRVYIVQCTMKHTILQTQFAFYEISNIAICYGENHRPNYMLPQTDVQSTKIHLSEIAGDSSYFTIGLLPPV